MLSFGEVPSVSRREEVREKALQALQRFDVLMVDGHFDYGNGYHGRVYLNPHQLFRRPSTVWRFAQDLIDVLPPEFVSRTEIVAGPATGGALLAHTLAGLLESEIEVGDDPATLGQVFERLRTQWIEERSAAEEAGTAAKEEATAARKALADLLEAAGLSDNDDVVEVIAAALTERTAKEAEVHLLEKRLASLEQLDGDEAELIAASDLLRTIHGDLSPSKFLEFVLDERRRALGALASEHLEILTAGRYRFDDSGEFLIVDLTAADAIRTPASLSGGETFLASLALALSLAEIVAREGGRLDAFFLDEGFGSLDPEHLDLAMDGIERLITTGPQRLVVVVSHVPAVRERIEDLVVLDRDPITGDSIVVSGASPP